MGDFTPNKNRFAHDGIEGEISLQEQNRIYTQHRNIVWTDWKSKREISLLTKTNLHTTTELNGRFRFQQKRIWTQQLDWMSRSCRRGSSSPFLRYISGKTYIHISSENEIGIFFTPCMYTVLHLGNQGIQNQRDRFVNLRQVCNTFNFEYLRSKLHSDSTDIRERLLIISTYI